MWVSGGGPLADRLSSSDEWIHAANPIRRTKARIRRCKRRRSLASTRRKERLRISPSYFRKTRFVDGRLLLHDRLPPTRLRVHASSAYDWGCRTDSQDLVPVRESAGRYCCMHCAVAAVSSSSQGRKKHSSRYSHQGSLRCRVGPANCRTRNRASNWV